MNNKRPQNVRVPWFLMILIISVILLSLIPFRVLSERITAMQLQDVLDAPETIVDVVVELSPDSDAADIVLELSDGRSVKATVEDVKALTSDLRANGIDYTISGMTESSLIDSIPTLMLVALAVFLLFSVLGNRGMGASGGGMNARLMNFGKSRAKLVTESRVRFSDVAGMEEEKKELREVVEFLKHPLRFAQMGARIPKGIILVGSPGTGKTLLAKAVAGEAGVPFYSISGSDFVEMYVGVGAARVRDLFEEAKKSSPCIIFIDEIDAVARRRGTGLGGSHDEREQTLNQLLVEMDGFAQNQGIIVMAATNRVDILDPAIMRPGRFDRKVAVSKPDVRAREEILKLHARNKRLSEDVDLEKVARTTAGFTGADLENILNEAAIEAAMEEKEDISERDIEEAFIKTGIGTEKRSKLISERDKRITAYHETGHAILFHELKDVGPVHIISIIPCH